MPRTAAQVTFALLLAWSFAPGTRELTEQVVHLVVNGHLAHSVQNDPDACPDDAEHGCQGPMHMCGCCHSTPWLVGTATAAPISASPPSRQIWTIDFFHDDPHLRGVFHPPKA